MSDSRIPFQLGSELDIKRYGEYVNTDRYKARAAELYAEVERLAAMCGIALKIPPDTPMNKFSEFIGHTNGSFNVFVSRTPADFATWKREMYGEADEPA